MSAPEKPVRTVLISPFDLILHDTPEGLAALQNRFAGWLRTLRGPARFISWQIPTSLNNRIMDVTASARHTSDPDRRKQQEEYRRYYMNLNDAALFQRSLAGLALWTEDRPATVAATVAGVFDTAVEEAPFPKLFEGSYRLRRSPLWHLAPDGAADGRPCFAILNSYEFLPALWSFHNPLRSLLMENLPLALCVDIPETFERNTAVTKIEGVIQAYNLHLMQLHGQEDSQAVRRLQDCYRTLEEINAGYALHRISISIAVAADDVDMLQERIEIVRNKTRSWFALRQEVGELLARSAACFSPTPTRRTGLPDTTHPVTSPELALLMAPAGLRRLGTQKGTLRGIALGGSYPVFHDSFKDKRAVHEIWVGVSGYGKTFALLAYLNRLYAERGIPFDYLEPMGHGKKLAPVFGVEPYIISAERTVLNPQDVMFPTLAEQLSHTIRIYESILKRPLYGDQIANLQRSLLAQALEQLYTPWLSRWQELTAACTPTCSDVCAVLATLGHTDRIRQLAREFADELAGLCTGSGPFASFLDGTTHFDFGSASSSHPRIFCFDELEGDPVLVAIAYTFTLSSIRRDSLASDTPRVIAVDEVYRLLVEDSLLDFLVEAAKTFRTRSKKLICIDQNLMFFLNGKARYIFENSPIRVIFSQAQGMGVFEEDAAFSHFNSRHLEIIRNLRRYEFLFDVAEEGCYLLHSVATPGELTRFGDT